MDPKQARNLVTYWPFVPILLAFCISSFPSHLTADAAPKVGNHKFERLALLSFKSLLSDPHGALSTWSNASLHHCRWPGVTCSGGRVMALDLASLSLVGPVSSYLANLTLLSRLHLANNKLYGPIPQELGHLSRLQSLNLSMNSLQGEIPTGLASLPKLDILTLAGNNITGSIPHLLGSSSSLTYVDLSHNHLIGGIPPSLTNSSSLKFLFLSTNSLRGGIPPSLGNSSSLAYIDLSSNSLTGGIPPSLGNSSSLAYIDLSSNSLTGGIPPSLGNSSSLANIDLSSNSLTGGIPPFLNVRSPLVHLVLSSNSLSGNIPPSLGNLSSLENLCLSENKLVGVIPDSIGSIPGLVQLDLIINNLFGRVPPKLYNISSIVSFRVADNNLTGTLPPDMGLTLPNLQFLNMQSNQFNGPIPLSLSNASGLQAIDLSINGFNGLVPSNLGLLRHLRYLILGSNQLQSHDLGFLSSLTNCSLLETLILQGNKLEGTLPKSIGNLSTQLNWLGLGKNQLSGTIPVEIGNLVNLTVLHMEGNHFTRTIPATIGNLRNLHLLYLSQNKLSGTIPSSIGSLVQLNELHMQENELSGSIPANFGSCMYLEVLNLSYNALNGTIPDELVSLSSLSQLLDLSHNSLSGSLPMKVDKLMNLGYLDVSNNQLSGEIPPTLGACQHLEDLHMQVNLFHGEIPPSFMNLRGLKALDLSRNNLSGKIPQFLETFHDLSYLNLSFNDFEGEVPKVGVFDNASEFSFLGNKKLCGGDPTLKLSQCSIQVSRRRLGFHAFLVILSVAISVITLALSLFCILYWRRKARDKPTSMSCLDDKGRNVSYTDIFKATGGFSSTNLIGTGSFSSVYKAQLDSEGSEVAVKVLDLDQRGASKSFTAECKALRNIRHRNLVKVITSCSSWDHKSNEFKALIFEFMPNGSVETWLHPKKLENCRPKRLNLIERLNIAIDVASALEYLHQDCTTPVIHCDLKPSNILLDNEMNAHVSDFGLARFLCSPISTSSNTSTSSMTVKGSIGYIAPEYGMGSPISMEGDVYSYGVLILEMITGKRPTDDMFTHGLSLHEYVEMAFPDRVMEILDPQMLLEEGEEGEDIITNNSAAKLEMERCVVALTKIGLSCSNKSPRDRMEMSDVANKVRAIKGIFSDD